VLNGKYWGGYGNPAKMALFQGVSKLGHCAQEL
jgi:hypothetical protein